jgi:hypothetical protein
VDADNREHDQDFLHFVPPKTVEKDHPVLARAVLPTSFGDPVYMSLHGQTSLMFLCLLEQMHDFACNLNAREL